MVGVNGIRFSSCTSIWCELYCVYKKKTKPASTSPSNTRLKVHDVAWTNWLRRSRRELSIRPRSTTLIRWFIVYLCVQKGQRLTNPRIGYTWTDSDTIPIDINRSQNIMHLTFGLVTEAHDDVCVCVLEKLHVEFHILPSYNSV